MDMFYLKIQIIKIRLLLGQTLLPMTVVGMKFMVPMLVCMVVCYYITVQTEQVANGIYTLATLIPAMLYLIVGASLAFLYPLTKRKVEENTRILKSRKKENEDTHA
jgi:Na+/melibiose symporter-like transporter